MLITQFLEKINYNKVSELYLNEDMFSFQQTTPLKNDDLTLIEKDNEYFIKNSDKSTKLFRKIKFYDKEFIDKEFLREKYRQIPFAKFCTFGCLFYTYEQYINDLSINVMSEEFTELEYIDDVIYDIGLENAVLPQLCYNQDNNIALARLISVIKKKSDNILIFNKTNQEILELHNFTFGNNIQEITPDNVEVNLFQIMYVNNEENISLEFKQMSLYKFIIILIGMCLNICHKEVQEFEKYFEDYNSDKLTFEYHEEITANNYETLVEFCVAQNKLELLYFLNKLFGDKIDSVDILDALKYNTNIYEMENPNTIINVKSNKKPIAVIVEEFSKHLTDKETIKQIQTTKLSARYIYEADKKISARYINNTDNNKEKTTLFAEFVEKKKETYGHFKKMFKQLIKKKFINKYKKQNTNNVINLLKCIELTEHKITHNAENIVSNQLIEKLAKYFVQTLHVNEIRNYEINENELIIRINDMFFTLEFGTASVLNLLNSKNINNFEQIYYNTLNRLYFENKKYKITPSDLSSCANVNTKSLG